jgi:hypothetical protein
LTTCDDRRQDDIAGRTPESGATVHIGFFSSHIVGDYSNGRLLVRVQAEDLRAGQTRLDDVSFSVPPDFHTHNDCVAAALITLVGKVCTSAEFNFPISQQCADMLAAYYGLADVGPIDPHLEPRRPGGALGLNFSGGLDSVSVWVLLHELMGEDIKVIHADYGPAFAREQLATNGYRLDVDCATDLRARGYDQRGRFLTAVPLLFADYADLGSLTHGNPYFHYPPLHVESTADGLPPRFLAHDAVVNAGGLRELHLIRGLMTWSTLQLLVAMAPERVEAALRASAAPGTVKHAIKSLALREIFERLGQPLPPALREWVPPQTLPLFGERLDVDTWALYFLRTKGRAFVNTFVLGLNRLDMARFEELSFEFLTKYNSSLVYLVPEPLRGAFTRVLHSFDIYPYSERDWRDLERYRAFLLDYQL